MLTKLEFAPRTDDDIDVINLIQELKNEKIKFSYINQLINDRKLSKDDFITILQSLEIQHKNVDESPSSPIEFDAYSKQITENLLDSINCDDSIKQKLGAWIRMPSKEMPATLLAYINILDDWKRNDLINKTDHMRRFKIRLYNELFSERIH